MLTYHSMSTSSSDLIQSFLLGNTFIWDKEKRFLFFLGNSSYRIASATEMIAFIYLTCSSLYTCIYVYIAKLYCL